MSKKIKCALCTYSMNWSLPEKVGQTNYEYSKHCLTVAKRSIVCGETMKSKPINHEQYCKKFKVQSSCDEQMAVRYKEEIDKLEQMIKEYESSISEGL